MFVVLSCLVHVFLWFFDVAKVQHFPHPTKFIFPVGSFLVFSHKKDREACGCRSPCRDDVLGAYLSFGL